MRSNWAIVDLGDEDEERRRRGMIHVERQQERPPRKEREVMVVRPRVLMRALFAASLSS